MARIQLAIRQRPGGRPPLLWRGQCERSWPQYFTETIVDALMDPNPAARLWALLCSVTDGPSEAGSFVLRSRYADYPFPTLRGPYVFGSPCSISRHRKRKTTTTTRRASRRGICLIWPSAKTICSTATNTNGAPGLLPSTWPTNTPSTTSSPRSAARTTSRRARSPREIGFHF